MTWLETPFLVSPASQEHYEPLNIFFLNSLFFYFINQNYLLWVATKNSGKYKNGHSRLWQSVEPQGNGGYLESVTSSGRG